MDIDSKAFSLFWQVYHGNSDFSNIIDEGFKNGKIRFFNDEEWNKINNQNFVSPVSEMKEFRDMFLFGYNVGNCVNTSRQLSYSYHNVDIVSGILPILKGTLNAEKEGEFEIVSMTGTLSEDGVHVHVSVSDHEGKTIGGHLKNGCIIYTTAEVCLLELETVKFTREFDEETGFEELVVQEKF